MGTAHIRDFISGSSNVIYRHNVAHDGSMSRVLSLLQLDVMVWPGMGSEVVFELYKKEASETSTSATATPTPAPNCNHDNCLRQFIKESSKVSEFCPTYTASSATAALPTFVSNCGGLARESHQHVRVSSRRLPQPLHQPPRRLPQLLEVATTSACCGRASREEFEPKSRLDGYGSA